MNTPPSTPQESHTQTTDIARVIDNFWDNNFFKAFLDSLRLFKTDVQLLLEWCMGGNCRFPVNYTDFIKKDIATQELLKETLLYFNDLERTLGDWLYHDVYHNHELPRYKEDNGLDSLIARVLMANDEEWFRTLFTKRLEKLKNLQDESLYEFLGEIRQRKIRLLSKIQDLLNKEDKDSPVRSKISEMAIWYIHDAEKLGVDKITEYTSPLANAGEHPPFFVHVPENIKKVFLEEYQPITKPIHEKTERILLFMRFRRNKSVTPEAVEEFVPFWEKYCQEHGYGPQTLYDFDTETIS